MTREDGFACVLALALLVPGSRPESAAPAPSADTGDSDLLQQLQQVHDLDAASMARVREVFAGSSRIGQGNPAVTRHPTTPQECQARIAAAGASYEQPQWDRLCGARYMAPLFDPAREKAEAATACIDRFEFPNVPCAYPVVWVKAREAAQLCEAVGKRLCDAHEWEGACAGKLEPPDYRFDLARGRERGSAVAAMKAAHNRARAADKAWSYGPAYRAGVCAASSVKSPGCGGGEWGNCGSNTFPAGSFPECHSALGVFDLNGNAAEHMNLPLDESQMASRGSRTLGVTEMKGSWFIFDRYRAHEDWCRWRAPFWHGSRVMDAGSHDNYHLGFRCCKTLP
ncbi:MAG: hypothetical protein NDJ94_14305 [Vicinamibacteria bacterium]|nr:hypothetical protein [Vicinamibacteria bacterium]